MNIFVESRLLDPDSNFWLATPLVLFTTLFRNANNLIESKLLIVGS